MFFATARGKRAARLDARAADQLGLNEIPGTEMTRMTYPHTQSPIGLYGELRPVMVSGVVVYHGSPEPPLFPGPGYEPSEYFHRTWKPGMLSWDGHRRATRAEFRGYLKTIHPRVAAALKTAREGTGLS